MASPSEEEDIEMLRILLAQIEKRVAALLDETHMYADMARDLEKSPLTEAVAKHFETRAYGASQAMLELQKLIGG